MNRIWFTYDNHVCLMPSSSRLWLDLPASVWDDLSTHCVPFQVPYIHAGETERGNRLGAVNRCPWPCWPHNNLWPSTKWANVTCCKGFHVQWFLSGVITAGMTDHVGFIKLLCIYPQGRLGCWEESPAPHFTDFDPPPLAMMLQMRMADRHQKVQTWTPTEVQ